MKEALLIYVAIAGTPIGLTLLWIWADEWLACEPEGEADLEPDLAGRSANR